MEIQNDERNQAAGSQEQSDSPSREVCLQTALDLANVEIQSLKKRISDMEQSQRQSEIAPCHSSQIPQGNAEAGFLEQMQVVIGRRQKYIQQQRERESELVDSLRLEVSLGDKKRQKMVQKYEAESQKLSESKVKIFTLCMENEDLSLRLRETQNQLMGETAERFQEDEASKARINYLVERAAKELDLKKQEFAELQDEHQREVAELKEAMATQHITNKSLLEKLSDSHKEASRQQHPWKRRCAFLDRRYKRTLTMSIHAEKDANQATRKVLNDKFNDELNKNVSLLARIGEMAGEQKLLEDIALDLKKKNRGVFGRRMGEREVELEKMKRKMRESQSETGGFISGMLRTAEPRYPTPYWLRSVMRPPHE